MTNELRNRKELRHGSKHRFDRNGSLVGDEIAAHVLECVDCGAGMLVITGYIGKRQYHFPIATEDIPNLVLYLVEVAESAEAPE